MKSNYLVTSEISWQSNLFHGLVLEKFGKFLIFFKGSTILVLQENVFEFCF